MCKSSSTASQMRSAVAVLWLAKYSVELLAALLMAKSHPVGSERCARGAAKAQALLGVSFHGPPAPSAPRAEQCACAVYAAARIKSTTHSWMGEAAVCVSAQVVVGGCGTWEAVAYLEEYEQTSVRCFEVEDDRRAAVPWAKGVG